MFLQRNSQFMEINEYLISSLRIPHAASISDGTCHCCQIAFVVKETEQEVVYSLLPIYFSWHQEACLLKSVYLNM